MEGWYQPMAARIVSDRSVVAVPQIDGIAFDTFAYFGPGNTYINGLHWSLLFTWFVCHMKSISFFPFPIMSYHLSRILPPNREIHRTKNDKTAPIRAPTHVGCAFSIDREFFYEIGSFDKGMDIWGSENVEMAFRVRSIQYISFDVISMVYIFQVWLCGGYLEVIPCSRIGHLYRKSTYAFDGDADMIIARNNVRLIEVWMDSEYKDLLYAAKPCKGF